MEEMTLTDKSIFDLVLTADPVVKLALLVLVFFSVVSWAIIIYKYRQVKKAQGDAQKFWGLFANAKSLQDITDTKFKRSGPLYAMFNTGLESIQKYRKGPRGQPKRETIAQKMTQAREEEIYKLEQHTSFLATTASTAPFVGLFGTVWGILMAFWTIGKAGSSSLATVGPYISEALIATAIGLAAAIPAVIAYNFFTHRIKLLIKMMDLFLDDFLLKMEEEA